MAVGYRGHSATAGPQRDAPTLVAVPTRLSHQQPLTTRMPLAGQSRVVLGQRERDQCLGYWIRQEARDAGTSLSRQDVQTRQERSPGDEPGAQPGNSQVAGHV